MVNDVPAVSLTRINVANVWWYLTGAKRKGPCSETDILQLLVSARIDGGTSIWREGMPSWSPLNEVPELNRLLASIPPPAYIEKAKTLAGPWRRLIARFIDLFLLSIPVALISFYYLLSEIPDFRSWIQSPGADYIFGMLITPFVMIAEAVIFGLFGTTCGKAIVGVRVTTISDERLSFGQYFERQWGVYVFGLALGIPIINLFAMALQRSKLKSRSSATYDIGQYKVLAPKLSAVRALFVAFSVLLLAMTNGVLGALSKTTFLHSHPQPVAQQINVWKNPLNSQVVSLPNNWKVETQTNAAGNSIEFISISPGATWMIITFEVIGQQVTTSRYADSVKKSLQESMVLKFDSPRTDPVGQSIVFGSGVLKDDSTQHVEVTLYRRANNMWRFIIVNSPSDAVQSYILEGVKKQMIATFQ